MRKLKKMRRVDNERHFFPFHCNVTLNFPFATMTQASGSRPFQSRPWITTRNSRFACHPTANHQRLTHQPRDTSFSPSATPALPQEVCGSAAIPVTPQWRNRFLLRSLCRLESHFRSACDAIARWYCQNIRWSAWEAGLWRHIVDSQTAGQWFSTQTVVRDDVGQRGHLAWVANVWGGAHILNSEIYKDSMMKPRVSR